jgi:predicted MFS family arabinose efflux permease
MADRAATSARDRLTLVLFTVIIALLYADQNLMAPSLTAIGQEFGFTRAQIDQHLGADVNLVFWMLGGTVTLAIGYLADRVDASSRLNRKWMLVVVALLGQAACLASGLARSYEALYWARAFTGLGIGGSFPLVYSLLGDYFPPQRRATATATIGLAMGLGIAFGQTAAGMLLATHGWRFPFFLVALPGMGFTLLYALVAREPARGRQEQGLQALFEQGGVYEERIRLRDIPTLFRVKTNVLIFLQGIPGTIPWGVFFVYLNDFYAHDKGFTVADATLLVMAIGAAAILGGFAGGLVGQWAFNRSPRNLPLLCATTTLGGVLPMAALISYPAHPGMALTGPLLIALATGTLAAVTGPNVRTMLINVNAPEHRGAAFSLFNLADDLGKGLGAWVVGALAAHLGRVPAFHIANLMWIFCGGVLLVLVRTFPRDQAALQAQLARLEAEGLETARG